MLLYKMGADRDDWVFEKLISVEFTITDTKRIIRNNDIFRVTTLRKWGCVSSLFGFTQMVQSDIRRTTQRSVYLYKKVVSLFCGNPCIQIENSCLSIYLLDSTVKPLPLKNSPRFYSF